MTLINGNTSCNRKELMFFFALTQDKHSSPGSHGGHAVGGDAFPHPLVVLREGLQQQRAVGFDGVRRATSRVDLHETKLILYTEITTGENKTKSRTKEMSCINAGRGKFLCAGN